MIRHYIKMAFRNLLRYKMQSIVSIVGIALGFTAFILGGYWRYWEHHFDTFHPDWKHTYALTTSGLYQSASGEDVEINQLLEEAQKAFAFFPEIEQFCQVEHISWQSDNKEVRWMGLRIDSAFFDFFRCRLLNGTYQGDAFNGESVILTRKTARASFGNIDCVGELFRVNSETAFTVVAVMEDYPMNTELKFDYLQLGTARNNSSKRQTTYARVCPNADLRQLSEKIEAYRIEQEKCDYERYANCSFRLRSLPEVHFRCSAGLKVRFRNIDMLAAAGILAFISALMNLLVLFIGKQQKKVRQTDTFVTLGASVRSLTGKHLLELAVPLLLAFLLALACIEIVFPYYQQYTQLANYGYHSSMVNIISQREVLIASGKLYLGASGLFLLISLFPILSLLGSKRRRVSVLLRNGLILGQIFTGAFFLVISLGLYSQYRFMEKTDKGITVDHIWQVDLGFGAVYSKDCRPFGEALRNSPYIEEVTAMSHLILAPHGDYYGSFVSSLPIEGRGEPFDYEDNCMAVQQNFLSFFGLQMVEGEWITNQGTYDYVINQTGARMLGIENIAGRRMVIDQEVPEVFRVSGVMKDYYYCPLQFPINKTFFVVLREPEEDQFYIRNRYYYIKVLPANREKALEYVRSLYLDYDKAEVESSRQIIYLPDLQEEFTRPERTLFSIFTVLGIICILISTFGIYSLVSLSAEQRQKEIAIRKVNGALYKDLLSLFLKEYLLLVALANGIALPMGYLIVSRWLESYAYHVSLSGWLFMGVFLVTCGVVIASVAHRVRYAVRVNPAEIIKSE